MTEVPQPQIALAPPPTLDKAMLDLAEAVAFSEDAPGFLFSYGVPSFEVVLDHLAEVGLVRKVTMDCVNWAPESTANERELCVKAYEVTDETH